MRTIHTQTEQGVTVYIQGLGETVKVLHVTDSHISCDTEVDRPYEQYSARMNNAFKDRNTTEAFRNAMVVAQKENVDLIALTGDGVNYPSRSSVEYVANAVKRTGIQSTYTAGNHDWHYEGMVGSSEAFSKQKGICPTCGRIMTATDIANREVETHHLVPRSLGGNEKLSNLQLLHKICHKLIHSVLSRKDMKKWKPINLNQVTTYPIRERVNKVSIRDFATPSSQTGGLQEFLSSLPNILKAPDFLELVDRIVTAHQRNKPVIVMMGGHVVKCGLSPILIDLMQRGIITALALNGGCSIHDFELALIGETSEDVGEYLQTGKFGMVEETGRLMNEAIRKAADAGIGMGEGLGQKLIQINASYGDYSLLAAGVRLGLPVTVHVAIGTDIIHQLHVPMAVQLGRQASPIFAFSRLSLLSSGMGESF